MLVSGGIPLATEEMAPDISLSNSRFDVFSQKPDGGGSLAGFFSRHRNLIVFDRPAASKLEKDGGKRNKTKPHIPLKYVAPPPPLHHI